VLLKPATSRRRIRHVDLLRDRQAHLHGHRPPATAFSTSGPEARAPRMTPSGRSGRRSSHRPSSLPLASFSRLSPSPPGRSRVAGLAPRGQVGQRRSRFSICSLPGSSRWHAGRLPGPPNRPVLSRATPGCSRRSRCRLLDDTLEPEGSLARSLSAPSRRRTHLMPAAALAAMARGARRTRLCRTEPGTPQKVPRGAPGTRSGMSADYRARSRNGAIIVQREEGLQHGFSAQDSGLGRHLSPVARDSR
jgi:hypothetical protein